jgi:hypothetical protein
LASLYASLFPFFPSRHFPVRIAQTDASLQVLVASLETLVIRRLVICYIATYLDVKQTKHLRSVKQMLRSPVFSSRWSDSEDAKMQAVIMLFSSKLLKATVVPNEEDPSDLTLVLPPQRAWPAVPHGRAKKK